MGKLTQIQGYVRMTLDKLPRIRSDLVRLDNDWQNWDFVKIIAALGEWTDRNPTDETQQSPQPTYQQPKRTADKSFSTRSEINKCVFCSGDHKPTSCSKITSVNERQNILKSKRCCFNCTKADHRASECKSRNCYKCNGRHHISIKEIRQHQMSRK